MAKFMDVHNGFFGVTGEQLAEAHQRDLDIENDEGVHYERAWLDFGVRQGLLPRHWALARGGDADPRARRSPDPGGLRTHLRSRLRVG